jgi:uncharacterized RDD family membrane protein YckC
MFVQFRLAAAVVYRFSLFLTVSFVFLGIARAADLTPHNLVAQGDSEQFWIARIEQTPRLPSPVHTTIYYRQLGQEGKWQALTETPLPARVVSLASRNGLAAALFDDGSWTLLYPDSGPLTGGPLPEPARMIALSGGATAWWAVGLVPGGIAGLPTTRPSSAATQNSAGAAIAASRPSSQPAAAQLVLFSLAGNEWQPRAELSEPVEGAPPAVSLGVIDDTPYLADPTPGGMRVRHLDKDHWVTDTTLQGLPALAGFKLLSTSQMPRLWVEPQSGPDRVYSLSASGTGVELSAIPGSAPADRAVAIATGKLRLLAIVKGDVLEQDYGLTDLHPDGGPSPVPLPRPSPLAELQQYQIWLVSLALILATLGWFRQRETLRVSGVKPEAIALAPFGRRLAAGLIDALPAILALAFGVIHFGSAQSAADPNHTVILLLIYWCAAIFYIVCLTMIEAVAGRSPGKVLMNLRIVGLDGKPATQAALITRNLLRVIDVGVWFLPVLLIVLMPLRQRAGDVAAGTLVVKGDGTPEPEALETTAATATTVSTPEES